MRENSMCEESRGIIQSLYDWGIEWGKRSEETRNRIEKAGGKVFYQASRAEGSKAEEFMLVRADGVYSFRVNGITRRSARSLNECVKQAREAGYLDEITAVEITKGKQAAEKAQKIASIRKLLNMGR